MLDQTIVAGLGNIYVDEVLFRSSIHPERIATTLTEQEIEALHEAIVETIREAIEKGEVRFERTSIRKGKSEHFKRNCTYMGV